MLKRLGRMYFEQGKFEQAIETYRRLITEEPQSPAAPDYQNEIIKRIAEWAPDPSAHQRSIVFSETTEKPSWAATLPIKTPSTKHLPLC